MATKEYGETITPPTIWWTVEDELTLSPGNWDEVEDVRFYTELEAVAYAQKRARDNFTHTRVVRNSSE